MSKSEFTTYILNLLQDSNVSINEVIAKWNEAIEKKNFIH